MTSKLKPTRTQRVRLLLEIYIQIFERFLSTLFDLVLGLLDATLDLLHLLLDGVHVCPNLLGSRRKVSVFMPRLLSCLFVCFLERLQRLTAARGRYLDSAFRAVSLITLLVVVFVISLRMLLALAEARLEHVSVRYRLHVVVGAQLIDNSASVIQSLYCLTAMRQLVARVTEEVLTVLAVQRSARLAQGALGTFIGGADLVQHDVRLDDVREDHVLGAVNAVVQLVQLGLVVALILPIFQVD